MDFVRNKFQIAFWASNRMALELFRNAEFPTAIWTVFVFHNSCLDEFGYKLLEAFFQS